MKRTLYITLMVMLLTLTACSGGSSTPQNGSANQRNSTPIELPAAARLLVGFLNLEGTEQAITAEQAAELLPLWYVCKDLSQSDTAAQEEIDALIEQMQEVTTPEQLKAIDAMQLTQSDMFTAMQGQNAPGGGYQGGGSQNNPGSSNRGGGDFPPGGFMPGGPGGFGEGGDPQAIATAQVALAQNANANQIPSALIDALIKLLESKTKS
jgi:hypothetical protein